MLICCCFAVGIFVGAVLLLVVLFCWYFCCFCFAVGIFVGVLLVLLFLLPVFLLVFCCCCFAVGILVVGGVLLSLLALLVLLFYTWENPGSPVESSLYSGGPRAPGSVINLT